MSTIPDLLDPKRLDQQRQLLREHGHTTVRLSDEAMAELTYVGRHPADLRRGSLPLISRTAREELNAKGLATFDDSDSTRWGLTELGHQIADLLVTGMHEQPRAAQLAEVRQRVTQLIHDSGTE
jgi:hypothetical protein